MTDVKRNVERVLDRIRGAARKAGRDPSDVKLVAASKMVDAERIRAAIEAGVGIIGENRVQEARGKISVLGRKAQWHLIGHLQRNKVKDAFAIFDMVQSVDNLPLAMEMEKRGSKLDRAMEILIEVNLGGEETKRGVPPEALAPLAREISAMEHLRVKGLMTIPPLSPDPEASRPFFKRLRELAGEIEGMGLPNVTMEELSMGMSGDFHVAVEEGATMVRIGTALFGPRPVRGG